MINTLGACPGCGVKPIRIRFGCGTNHSCADCGHQLTWQEIENLEHVQVK